MNAYQLIWKGFKWSYDEYGVTGALAFIGVVALGYYLLRQRLNDAFGDGDATAA